MKQHTIQIKTNAGYAVRTEQHQGREHWVVPVVMMVEGVHAGSHGPLYYPSEELAQFPASWNGIPVVINHPAGGVSANSPDLAEAVVGHVYNSVIDGTKLKAEVWLDVMKVTALSPLTAEAIQAQRPLEVSVGVYTEEDDQEGTWNNEHYVAIARNYRPDHLALLPDAVGACSWNDGCGIRTNKMKGGLMNDKKDEVAKQFDIATVTNHLTQNETGFREISSGIQQRLDAMDTQSRIHMLEEVYDDYFVYRILHTSSAGPSGSEYYKRNYQVQNDGSIDIQGDPVQVRKNVTYETVNTMKRMNKANSKTNNSMTKTKDCAPCEQKIAALIANTASKFTEDDRSFLESLEEEQLDKLVPNEVKPPVEKKKDPAPEQTTNKKDESAATPKSFEDQFKEMVANSTKPEDFIDRLFPKELGEQMKSGLKMHRDKRETLVKSITENSDFTEEDLEDFSMERLEKLNHAVVKEEVDYTANGGGFTPRGGNAATDEEADAMLYINNAFVPEKEKQA